MKPNMKNLGIDHLSAEERVELAIEIWESRGNECPSARLSDEQRTELARRDAELDAHPEQGLTWEQIRSGLDDKP